VEEIKRACRFLLRECGTLLYDSNECGTSVCVITESYNWTIAGCFWAIRRLASSAATDPCSRNSGMLIAVKSAVRPGLGGHSRRSGRGDW